MCCGNGQVYVLTETFCFVVHVLDCLLTGVHATILMLARCLVCLHCWTAGRTAACTANRTVATPLLAPLLRTMCADGAEYQWCANQLKAIRQDLLVQRVEDALTIDVSHSATLSLSLSYCHAHTSTLILPR